MDTLKTIVQKISSSSSSNISTKKAIVILPYTPQSDLETELEIGDYVIFDENSENKHFIDEEWVHGRVVSEVREDERWAVIPRHCIKFI